jgi:hypothetical protein
MKRQFETRSHLGSPRTFEAARNKYRPDQVKLLFVAEAPPAYDSGRFFYFEAVEEADTLFLEMMKVLYPKKANFVEGIDNRNTGFKARQVRNRKAEFLELFKRDGFFLLDAIDEPMPGNATTKTKEDKIRSSLPQLRDNLRVLRRGLAKGQHARSQWAHDQPPGAGRAEALPAQTSRGAQVPSDRKFGQLSLAGDLKVTALKIFSCFAPRPPKHDMKDGLKVKADNQRSRVEPVPTRRNEQVAVY